MKMPRMPLLFTCLFVCLWLPTQLYAQQTGSTQAAVLGRRVWLMSRSGRTDNVISQPFSEAIRQGADLNYKDPDDGTTALMWCARLGNEIEFYKLITQGASPYAIATRMITDRNGEPAYMGTVLTAAVQGGSYGIVRHLVETARVPVDQTGPGNGGLAGPTPLLIASMLGRLDVVLLLLRYNANINKPGAADNLVTPLMAAAGSGQATVCEYLLKMGANPFIKDRTGRMAKDWAIQNQHPDLAAMIDRYIDQTAITNPVEDRNRGGSRMYSSLFRFDNLEQIGRAYEQNGRMADAQLNYIKAAQALYNEAQAEETGISPAFPLADLYHLPFDREDQRVITALSSLIQAEQQVNHRVWYFLGLMQTMKNRDGSLTQRPMTIQDPSAEYVAQLTRQLQRITPDSPLLPDLLYLSRYIDADARSTGEETNQFYNRIFGSAGIDNAVAAARPSATNPAATSRYLTLLIDGVRDALVINDTLRANRQMQQALAAGVRYLPPGNPMQAALLGSAGDCFRRMATPVAFNRAEHFYRREQAHIQLYSPRDTLATLRNLLGFAKLYADWNLTNPAKAAQYLDRAATLVGTSEGLPAGVWVALYGQWADLEARSRDWTAAAGHYSQLLNRLRQQSMTTHPIYAIVLYNTGCAYRDMGNWPAAIDYFRQANQYAGQFGQLMTDNLYTFAKNYADTYRVMLHQGLWEAFGTLSARTSTDLANATKTPWLSADTRQGWLLAIRQRIDSPGRGGQTQGVESEMRLAVQQLEQPENLSPFTIRAMLLLARVYQKVGTPLKADSLYAHTVALALEQWGTKSPVYWEAALEQVNYRLGQPGRATGCASELRELCRLMRTKHLMVQPYLPTPLARLYHQETETFFSGLVQAARQLNQPASPLIADLLTFSIQLRTYQFSAVERMSEQYRRSDPTLARWLDRLNDYKLTYRQAVQNRTPTPDERRGLASTLADMTTTEEGVLRLLLANQQKSPLPAFSLGNWQKRLALNEAYVQFIRVAWDSVTRADYLAFVVRANSPARLVYLTNETSLARAIPPGPTDDAAAERMTRSYRQLFGLLWKPVADQLRGISRVQYSPAGLVHRVSLAGLLNESGHPLAGELTWLGRFTIDEQPDPNPVPASPRILLYGNALFEPTRTTAAGGQPAFPDSPTALYRTYQAGPWLPLAGTGQEIAAIDELARRSGLITTVRTGAMASESQFVKDVTAAGPTILHVATHGFYLGYVPQSEQFFGRATDPLLRSGIILAGANGVWLGTASAPPERDGILTALEVSTLPLATVQLAVLSACETGLGEMQGTDGVLGMARALKMAGVKYVIVSLWPVPDTITKELMTEFYQALWQKQPVEAAFHVAQRKLAASYGIAQWAGFVLLR